MLLQDKITNNSGLEREGTEWTTEIIGSETYALESNKSWRGEMSVALFWRSRKPLSEFHYTRQRHLIKIQSYHVLNWSLASLNFMTIYCTNLSF